MFSMLPSFTRGIKSCAASGFIMSTTPLLSLRTMPTGERYMNESRASYSDSSSVRSAWSVLTLSPFAQPIQTAPRAPEL
jgi:hypothetical protein